MTTIKRISITKNFYLDEYFDKNTYNRFIHKPHIMIGLLDDRIVRSDQMLRDKFGVITINNWWSNGNREWSGLRFYGSPQYSATSQHSYGRASDKIFKDISADEVRKYIKQNWKELGITCIEENVDWLHSDVRALQDPNNLLIVYP